jgi:hypothetical protein
MDEPVSLHIGMPHLRKGSHLDRRWPVLLAKATLEIHERLEGERGYSSARVRPSFTAVIAQIVVLDIVFPLDSVITSVGMADEITINECNRDFAPVDIPPCGFPRCFRLSGLVLLTGVHLGLSAIALPTFPQYGSLEK